MWNVGNVSYFTYPVRLLARSRANLARRLRQQITNSAKRGKPRMQDTMGITIDSGDTATNTTDVHHSHYTALHTDIDINHIGLTTKLCL
jgi:hypothetical protein